MTSESLARRTVGGTGWAVLSSVLAQVVAMTASALVARRLGPADYGTAALAMVFVGLSALVADLGLAPAIVSGRLAAPQALGAAQLFMLAAASGLAALGLAVAPFAARHLGDPQLAIGLPVAAFAVPAGALATVPIAVLMNRGHFRTVAGLGLLAQSVGSASAVLIAYLGGGVLALVVPALLVAAVRAVLAWTYYPISLPSPRALALLRPHVREGWRLTASGVADALFRSGDRLIIAGHFAPGELGRYSLSRSLVSGPLSTLSDAISSPLLSSLGLIRDDLTRFDRAAVRACCVMTRVSLPIFLTGAVVAPELVRLFLGDKWASISPMARTFLVLAPLQVLGSIAGRVWMARGHSRLVLRWSLASNGGLLAVFAFGAWLGSVEQVAFAFALYSGLVLAPALVLVTKRVCGLPLHGLARCLARVARDAAMALVVAALGRAGGFALWGDLGACVLGTAAGGFSYLVLSRLLSPADVRDLLTLLPAPVAEPLRRALVLSSTHMH